MGNISFLRYHEILIIYNNIILIYCLHKINNVKNHFLASINSFWCKIIYSHCAVGWFISYVFIIEVQFCGHMMTDLRGWKKLTFLQMKNHFGHLSTQTLTHKRFSLTLSIVTLNLSQNVQFISMQSIVAKCNIHSLVFLRTSQIL